MINQKAFEEALTDYCFENPTLTGQIISVAIARIICKGFELYPKYQEAPEDNGQDV